MGKSCSKNMNSFHNIIILILFVLGLFILYRYIKNLENETKILHNHIIELTSKLQTITDESNKKQNITEYVVNEEKIQLPNCIFDTTNNDNDNESVQSEDITNMLKKVMETNEDKEVDEIVDSISYEEQQSVINDIEIIDDVTNQDTIEINIAAENSKEFYMKKTNEELRSILKNKSLSTKGSKAELVDRILQNN